MKTILCALLFTATAASAQYYDYDHDYDPAWDGVDQSAEELWRAGRDLDDQMRWQQREQWEAQEQQDRQQLIDLQEQRLQRYRW